MSENHTIESTVALVEAWLAASEEGARVDPAIAAARLADLFVRAERGGADLHDPTAELLRWLTRDLARDDDVTIEAYHDALGALSHYLLYLRAHRLWRRSERAVQDCWDVMGWASQQPLGLATLGSTVDATIAEQLAHRPDPRALVAFGVERAFAQPLRATLDALVARGELTLAETSEIVGLAADSATVALWTRALEEADLAAVDEDGRLSPLSEVRDAGGCPPPSSFLIHRVVRGLARAAILHTLGADADEDLHRFPRGMGTLIALVAATDPAYYVAEAEDDDESSTDELAALFVEQALPEATEAERAPYAAEVMALLDALVRFGVLDRVTLERGGVALLAPEPFKHALARAVADTTGVVGTPDDTVAWAPVELPFTMAPDTALDLLVSLEHDPSVWRRLRVNGGVTMAFLHDALQRAFTWRDVRSHVFCLPDGTRRFAAPWLLGQLDDEADELVVDGDAVRLGSVLRASGEELLYLYGHLGNPWRVRIRVERVMSGMSEQLSWLDSAGAVPAEPSRIGWTLQQRLPEGATMPPELERAWVFMESRRWMMLTDDGIELVAPGPPAARPAVVFSSGLSLAHKVGENSPVLRRTLPIAVSPDDATIALWWDDDGAPHVVRFGSDGEANLLGSPLDLLRLAAIGYEELSARVLAEPPQDPAAVAGVREFRAWVQGNVGAGVPDRWGQLRDDNFTAWVAAHRD